MKFPVFDGLIISSLPDNSSKAFLFFVCGIANKELPVCLSLFNLTTLLTLCVPFFTYDDF